MKKTGSQLTRRKLLKDVALVGLGGTLAPLSSFDGTTHTHIWDVRMGWTNGYKE